ncbi:MAG: type II secretion system protein [Phycisphaerae bacterium]|jgi:prepilin-type N-terminal cleavage/methylation domain-containing protein/prepilin-type processing-associated H-X9-DG protein
MNKKNKSAFTLIELLVVISIIAMLMAILMPALGRARQAGQKIVCAAHQRSFGVGFEAYLQDNRYVSHWGPNRGYWYVPNTRNKLMPQNSTYAYWGVAYFPYLKNRDVFHCPTSRYKLQTWNEADDTIEVYNWAHYGFNGFVSNRYISRVKRPGEVIVMQDHFEQKLDNNGDMFMVKPGESYNLTQWRNRDSLPDAIVECFRHSRSSRAVESEEPWSPKQKGYSNTLWLDGHVEPIKQSTGEDLKVFNYTGGYGNGTQSAFMGNTPEEALSRVIR